MGRIHLTPFSFRLYLLKMFFNKDKDPYAC